MVLDWMWRELETPVMEPRFAFHLEGARYVFLRQWDWIEAMALRWS